MIDTLFDFAQVFIEQAIAFPVENLLGKIYVILNSLLLLSGFTLPF